MDSGLCPHQQPHPARVLCPVPCFVHKATGSTRAWLPGTRGLSSFALLHLFAASGVWFAFYCIINVFYENQETWKREENTDHFAILTKT